MVVCRVVVVFVLYDLSDRHAQIQTVKDRKKQMEHKETQQVRARDAVHAAQSHLVLCDVWTGSHRGNIGVIIEVAEVKLFVLFDHVFLWRSLHLKRTIESK